MAGFLLPDEQCAVDVRRHWAVLLPALLKFGGIALAFLFLAARASPGGTAQGMAIFAVLAMLARIAWELAEWRFDRFLVTDKRVLLVSGLLTRRVAMMPLKKVTDMTYERSWIGRLLGYGAFVIESAGQDQALHRVDFLPWPDEVAHRVFGLLFGSESTITPSAVEPADAPGWWRPDPPTHGSLLVPRPDDD